MRALVVFHDHGTHVLARFMKTGFKHCFVAIETDGLWVTLDGRAGLAVVEIAAPAYCDLAAFYRAEGFTVVEAEQSARVPFTVFVPYNCVGLVKAVLAIGAPLVVTPWQLFKFLERRRANS